MLRSFSSTSPLRTLPERISGPFVSNMIAQVRRVPLIAVRMFATVPAWYCAEVNPLDTAEGQDQPAAGPRLALAHTS